MLGILLNKSGKTKSLRLYLVLSIILLIIGGTLYQLAV